MPTAIQITYLHHSGFVVRTRDTLLVFDDVQKPPAPGDSLATGYVTPALIAAHRRTIFFVSHRHGDHFSPNIYAARDMAGVQYVLGHDVPPEHPGHRMRCGDTFSLGDITIEAHGSTDEGVSFLVTLPGWTIFHAGDLNLWHWREESTLKEIAQAETEFKQAVEPLLDREIDFAFFPVDPRMGEMYDAGAIYFLMHVRPRVMIPMHWWGRDDVAVEFARRNRNRYGEIVALTAPGDTLRAEKRDEGGIHIDL